ncbi:MAG: DUF3892 domain-containing protein [Chitinophagales bacterium]
MGKKIVAVRKDGDGNLTEFKLDDGTTLDYDSAISMAENGELERVDVLNRKTRKVLRSEPDDTRANNLDNLPEF